MNKVEIRIRSGLCLFFWRKIKVEPWKAFANHGSYFCWIFEMFYSVWFTSSGKFGVSNISSSDGSSIFPYFFSLCFLTFATISLSSFRNSFRVSLNYHHDCLVPLIQFLEFSFHRLLSYFLYDISINPPVYSFLPLKNATDETLPQSNS